MVSGSLVLKDESRDRPPYAIDSFDHLKTREFDELWDMFATPRTKLDRSYGDQLQDRQYIALNIFSKIKISSDS